MTRLSEIEEAAKAAKGWSNCTVVREIADDGDEEYLTARVGALDDDGNFTDVLMVDCAQYFAAEQSIKLATHIAKCNPATILELVALTRQLGEALRQLAPYADPGTNAGKALAELAKWEE